MGLHLAESIRTARTHAGLSRRELDERARVRPRTTERIEVRHQAPGPDTLRAIATALGTTPEALRGEPSPPLASVVDGLVARYGVRAVLEEVVRSV